MQSYISLSASVSWLGPTIPAREFSSLCESRLVPERPLRYLDLVDSQIEQRHFRGGVRGSAASDARGRPCGNGLGHPSRDREKRERLALAFEGFDPELTALLRTQVEPKEPRWHDRPA
jgi:hypothetical protein